MKRGAFTTLSAIAVTSALAACANSGFDLSTSSVTPQPVAVAQKTDPACVAITNQINTLRSDGAIEKLEKAANGKSAKVEVKRTALEKQTLLNKAYADFQTRCGPTLPSQVAVQQPPPAAAPVTPPAKTANASSPDTSGSISASPVSVDAN